LSANNIIGKEGGRMARSDGLDSRKRYILQAIIEDYINRAEPIGSRTIARKYDLGLSSATIRNEMADLEELGYLVQPHTSAGRIPSQKGYRLYVDEFVKLCELSREEMRKMREALESQIHDIDEIIKVAIGLISELTEYTSIGVTAKMKKILIKAVQVVPVGEGKALVVVVLDGGQVKNSLISVDNTLLPENLISISNILNESFYGKTIEQIEMINEDEIIDVNINGMTGKLLRTVVKAIKSCLESIDTDVFTEGRINIFNYPEFQDIIKAKMFLKTLQEKEKVLSAMSDSFSKGGIVVRIGTENMLDELKDCSLITATYSVDDVFVGSIGIVGPTRMQYGKVLSSLHLLNKYLQKQINNLLGE